MVQGRGKAALTLRSMFQDWLLLWLPSSSGPQRLVPCTACRKKKKSCPCPRTSVPSYPCSLISHSHLSQTDVTVSVLLPSSQGHQTPTRLHHVTLVPHTICGHESQLLQAFLSILCLNWKLHEGRCFLSFTKQDMHLVNVHRTEWMSESPFVPSLVSFLFFFWQ